jgi:hypothetical protein
MRKMSAPFTIEAAYPQQLRPPKHEVDRRGASPASNEGLYPHHRSPPCLTEDATRARSNRLLDAKPKTNVFELRKRVAHSLSLRKPSRGLWADPIPTVIAKGLLRGILLPINLELTELVLPKPRHESWPLCNYSARNSGYDAAKPATTKTKIGHLESEDAARFVVKVKCPHGASNDEVERRGASPASSEGTLSQSPILPALRPAIARTDC